MASKKMLSKNIKKSSNWSNMAYSILSNVEGIERGMDEFGSEGDSQLHQEIDNGLRELENQTERYYDSIYSVMKKGDTMSKRTMLSKSMKKSKSVSKASPNTLEWCSDKLHDAYEILNDCFMSNNTSSHHSFFNSILQQEYGLNTHTLIQAIRTLWEESRARRMPDYMASAKKSARRMRKSNSDEKYIKGGKIVDWVVGDNGTLTEFKELDGESYSVTWYFDEQLLNDVENLDELPYDSADYEIDFGVTKSAKKSKKDMLKSKLDAIMDDEIAKPKRNMFLDSRRKSTKSDENGEDADEYREESDGDDVSGSTASSIPGDADDNEDMNEAPSGGNSELPGDADDNENQSSKRRKRLHKLSVTNGGSAPYNGRQNYNQSPMMREAIDRYTSNKELAKSLQSRVDEIIDARGNRAVNNLPPLRIRGKK